MVDLNETTFESTVDLLNYLTTLEVKPEDISGKTVKSTHKDSCLWIISFTDGTFVGADAGDYHYDTCVTHSSLGVFEVLGILPDGFLKRHQDLWSQNSQKQYKNRLYAQYKTLAKKFGPLPPEELEKL